MRGFSRHRDRVRRIGLAAAVLLVIVAVIGWFLLMKCRPVVTAFAESNAHWVAEQTANDAVAAVLEEKADVCRSMVAVTYTDENILSSVMTDAASINTVKTAITAEILRRMDDLAVIETEIPLGSLLGFRWLSGWGPRIRFPVGVTCSILSTVSSGLDAVGINQSSYRVCVDLKISLCVITPGGQSGVSVDASFPVAETVLLGSVPDALTEVYGDDQSNLGKVFDYGAEK